MSQRCTVASYREDRLDPRVVRAVDILLKSGNFVAPVDVLIQMELLSREQYENWRRGHVPYPERVIECNLSPRPPASDPALPCARPEAQALLDGMHALGEGASPPVSLHEDGRSEAGGGVRDALRMAGQTPVPRCSGRRQRDRKRHGSRTGRVGS
jgi:hypothetical protein